MSDKHKAYLMHRDEHPGHGVTEIWQAEDGRAFYVDFNAYICQTMVFPYDLKLDRVKNWLELWHKDMTGGRVMRELGYEPVEKER